MFIAFNLKTNHDTPNINTAIFKLKDGTKVRIDRDKTSYSYHDGYMEMAFISPYLWDIELASGSNLICKIEKSGEFDLSKLNVEELHMTDEQTWWKELMNAEVEMEIEDDAPEDYFATVTGWSFC